VKIITWNVNGIRARGAQLVELIERERPDALCLQELKAKREQVPEALCDLGGYWCYWHALSAYSGVGLHVKKDRFSEAPAFTHPAFDHETRIVEARIGNLSIASVYVPNGGKDYAAKLRFLEAMEDYAAEARDAGRSLIVCGDINVARTDRDVHPKERKPNAIGQRPEERDLFERILGRGLIDVGRSLDPENDELFTWWAPWRNLRQRNIGWRLDYVLATKDLAQSALSCPVLREFGTSDHGPVVATFGD
jgi:exodeoxyribonuclease III